MTPADLNGLHKATAERALMLYHELFGLEACSLRLTNTYGPRMQMRHSRQGFAPWFVRLAIEGVEIPLYGGGGQLRDFNEVEDVVRALLLAGTHPQAVGACFNLGHPEPVTLRAFAELLIEVTGSGSVRDEAFPSDRARIEIGSVHVDSSRIRELLGWEPRVDLRSGLARAVAYYREHRAQYW